jgi:hypothetical protein
LKPFALKKHQDASAWMQHSQLFIWFRKSNKDFSYTIFPVNKINVGKILKLWENCCLIILSIHTLKLEISGCDKSTPLKGISSRDSKKEKTRRREINKNIAAKVGRRSSTFVDQCEVFNLFPCWLLGSSSEWSRWDKRKHKVGRKVEWCFLFFILLTYRWWRW